MHTITIICELAFFAANFPIFGHDKFTALTITTAQPTTDPQWYDTHNYHCMAYYIYPSHQTFTLCCDVSAVNKPRLKSLKSFNADGRNNVQSSVSLTFHAKLVF